MIKSMTGFGRAEVADASRKFTVEIKSVNHRYLDVNIKLPKTLNFFESAIRSLLKEYIERGKVDVFISYEDYTEENYSLKYNAGLAEQYMTYLKEMAEQFGIENDVRVSTLSRYPDVFVMEEQSPDEQKLWAGLEQALRQAAAQFVESRIKEGERLRADLVEKLDGMISYVDYIEERSPQILEEYRMRLESKVQELLGDRQLDDARIAAEITIFADKICVDEETVRLRSHILSMKETLLAGGGMGRKLDFIAQEMNREANTILSKTTDLKVSDVGINLKTDIEKVREQHARIVEVTDRAVADKDDVTLDFEGFVDGVAFEGGKGENYPLTIGSGSFIPGFEEQLIGAEIDKEVEVKVTFPEDYHSEDLKGKEAVFKCTVHAIRAKELPEVDDEFASDVSEKAETLDAYRAEVKAQIKERKENEGKAKKEDQAVEQAVANAEIDLPEPMVDLQAKQMADDFARRIMQQGLSVEQYFQFTGLSEEKMMEELKPQAEKRIRTRLVLEAIVAAENIEVSDERLDEELAKMAESYKMEVEKLKEFMGENEKKQMKEDIAVQDAVTLIVDASVEG